MTEHFSFQSDLNSDYDCSQANHDVPRLKEELASLKSQYPDAAAASQPIQEQLHHVENQLHFIKNKCRLN
ncbi:hypothetical protein [Paenibacillus assamensis]|uniref:hypothetical protein n=1 Tax=Paenibacillus assamensis TaxID=311244 RepID=UPI00040EA093|nr:hypothetical protein [Paenibacillus assamensis]